MHFASNWLLLAVFNETQEFFRITNLVFEISFFVTCWEISLIQSHFTANLLFLTILKKIIFFLKTYLFFSKKLKLERFEKTYLFGRILQQICYLYHFLKNRIFFSKKPIQFLKKTPIFRKFWEFVLFQWPCSVTLLLLRFWRHQFFFEKPIYFFFKKRPIPERFEKSYKVGCFLHQIGCF